MKKRAGFRRIVSVILGAGLIVGLGALSPASALQYEGGISTVDGSVVGTSGSAWASGPSSIQWVINKNIDGSWHYNYEIMVPSSNVSHSIIEATNPFANAFPDLYDIAGDFSGTEVGTFDATGNPGIPGSIYGIKFNNFTGTDVLIDFDSVRSPVWGNFYATDGMTGDEANAIWNSSFLDPNPSDDPSDGSVNNKILRPDSPVPEPAALALIPMGLVPFIRLRRKTAK